VHCKPLLLTFCLAWSSDQAGLGAVAKSAGRVAFGVAGRGAAAVQDPSASVCNLDLGIMICNKGILTISALHCGTCTVFSSPEMPWLHDYDMPSSRRH
jgi:hypothetical protein